MADDLKTQIHQGIAGVLNDPLNWPDGFNQALPAHLEVNPPLLLLSQLAGFSTYKTGVEAAIAAISAGAGSGVSALSAQIVALSAQTTALTAETIAISAAVATNTSKIGSITALIGAITASRGDTNIAGTVDSVSSSTFFTSANAPTVAIVRNGNYIISYGGMVVPGALDAAYIGLNSSSGTPTTADEYVYSTFVGRSSLSKVCEYNMSSGDDLTVQVRTDLATGTFAGLYLAVIAIS